ncbi:MAG: Rrf2 family transcriptional regulator [Parcubacteria group bacterium]
MRLTTYTDYTLRVLMYVASEPDRLATIGEIAGAHGISKNHLMKVVNRLGAWGLLANVRGKGGGLRLARAPETIGLGEVIRKSEPDFALVPCFQTTGGACAIRPACSLRHALAEAQAAFLAVLDRYTLADLVANKSMLNELLVRQPVARQSAEVA